MKPNLNFFLIIGVVILMYLVFSSVILNLNDLSFTVNQIAAIVASLEPGGLTTNGINLQEGGDDEKKCPDLRNCKKLGINANGEGASFFTARDAAEAACDAKVLAAKTMCKAIQSEGEKLCLYYADIGCEYTKTVSDTTGSCTNKSCTYFGVDPSCTFFTPNGQFPITVPTCLSNPLNVNPPASPWSCHAKDGGYSLEQFCKKTEVSTDPL